MVNETLYNYLKENKDKYPLLKLKSKILKSGYSEEQFNEVLSMMGIDLNTVSESKEIPIQQNDQMSLTHNPTNNYVNIYNNQSDPKLKAIRDKIQKHVVMDSYDPVSVAVLKKIKTVGMLSIAWGIIGIVGTIIFVSLYSFVINAISIEYALILEQNGIGFLDFLIFSIVPILFFALNIVAGIGLMKHRNGGRYLLIFLSIINLFIIGIGTILGTIFLFLVVNKDVRSLMK